MTGPEHYREAEELLDFAATLPSGDKQEEYTVAVAQVHATLALAAATAMNDGSAGFGVRDWDQWREVVSLSKPTNLDHEDPE